MYHYIVSSRPLHIEIWNYVGKMILSTAGLTTQPAIGTEIAYEVNIAKKSILSWKKK